MWVPKTVDELIEQVTTGDLQETAIFDAKQLPSKNKDIAIDVAAMSTNGGVIIYGVGEDEHKRLTILTPFPLAGVAERIDSVIQSSIAEPPRIRIHTLTIPDDPAQGYLIVEVPPSPRAPHMVIVGHDHRYYGRGATGNVRLTEGDVARLYERRLAWDRNRARLLDDIAAQAPLASHNEFAYLHVVCQPVMLDEQLFDKARKHERDHVFLNQLLSEVSRRDVWSDQYRPDFRDYGDWRRQPDRWSLSFDTPWVRNTERRPKDALDLHVQFDGGGSLFCGRAAERKEGTLLIIEDLIAGLTTRFTSFFGRLYKEAMYIGPVDMGVAVTGIRGAISYTLSNRHFADNFVTQEQNDYRRTGRFLARDLTTHPEMVAKELVMPLMRAVTQDQYDPFHNAHSVDS